MAASINAYYGYIASRLQYGIIFWGTSVDVNRVFVAQKLCIRRIFNMSYNESCKPFFIKYNLLTFYSIYILESIAFVKNNYNLFIDLETKHSYNTRNKNQLNLFTAKHSYIKRNVMHSVISIYNKLPNNLKSLETKQLKVTLKKHCIQMAYYNLDEFFNDDFSYLLTNIG